MRQQLEEKAKKVDSVQIPPQLGTGAGPKKQPTTEEKRSFTHLQATNLFTDETFQISRQNEDLVDPNVA